MIDEGYIKFNIHWDQSPPLTIPTIEELIFWRQQCYAQQLIGAYDNGIGFGNISIRKEDTNGFFISGSATGNERELDINHFAEVLKVDAPNNQLWCKGPIVASSESMSHAIIYASLPWVKAVIHIHDIDMWKNLMHKVPTTDASAPYGSPEMVESIAQLIQTTNLAERKIFVMEGHEEGVFVFGDGLETAFDVIQAYKM